MIQLPRSRPSDCGLWNQRFSFHFHFAWPFLLCVMIGQSLFSLNFAGVRLQAMSVCYDVCCEQCCDESRLNEIIVRRTVISKISRKWLKFLNWPDALIRDSKIIKLFILREFTNWKKRCNFPCKKWTVPYFFIWTLKFYLIVWYFLEVLWKRGILFDFNALVYMYIVHVNSSNRTLTHIEP